MADHAYPGVTPEQLDDRLQLAVIMINARLFGAGRRPLTESEREVLRTPSKYRGFVTLVGARYDIDVTAATALLDHWHAWRGR